MNQNVENSRPYFRYVAFTHNNYTEHAITVWKAFIETECQYGCFQREVGAAGTPHLQGYFIVRLRRRLEWLRRRCPHGAHFEKARGNPQQNKAYCSKEGGQDFWEFGICPEGTGGQGNRTDIDEVVELVKRGRTLEEIADECPVQYVKYHRGIESLKSKLMGKRNFKTEVHWYWGPTGTGKSREAAEKWPDAYYKMPCNKWWDGYNGEETVIIDDYRKDLCTFAELLRLLDRYAHRVENKGGSIPFCSKRIVITSCKHPEAIWEGRTEEDLAQLMRRIDVIKYFGPPAAPLADTFEPF